MHAFNSFFLPTGTRKIRFSTHLLVRPAEKNPNLDSSILQIQVKF